MYTMKKSKQDGTAEEVYGLITVLPREGTGDAQQRTVILSDLASAGIQAAAEYFASPHHLLEFQNRRKTEGQTAIPSAYQIVIKATAKAWLPLGFQYETPRILAQ